MHEQSAVHLADGYYRATGTPILGVHQHRAGRDEHASSAWRTAYVDSTAVALATGSPHTYMRGPACSRSSSAATSPTTRGSSSRSSRSGGSRRGSTNCRSSSTGRGTRWSAAGPGPILLDLPMDVQAEAADVRLPEPEQREARGRVRPAADDVERAARRSADAERPVIVAGGGAISAEAWDEVTALAERLGAPVVTTWNGKGAIDETHELAGLTIGDTASTVRQRARGRRRRRCSRSATASPTGPRRRTARA